MTSDSTRSPGFSRVGTECPYISRIVAPLTSLMECDSNPVTFLTQWAAVKLEKKEDNMDYLFADRYSAKDYFKLLLNSIYGKNYFCVMIEGGNGNFYSTKNTRLRVRDGKNGTEYLLDHVKRMHV